MNQRFFLHTCTKLHSYNHNHIHLTSPSSAIMSDTKARKSSRRPKTAESLHEHFDGNHSAPAPVGYDEEEEVAESWSSHDISAGAAAAAQQKSSVTNRRSSVGGSSSKSTGGASASPSTSSRQRRESSRREGRDRSPTGNSSVKSERSNQQSRNGSHRHLQSPTASSRTLESGKSPYKGLSKLAAEEHGTSTPLRTAKKASSGIPRAPAVAGLVSPRKTSAHHRMSAAAGNSSLSSGISNSSSSSRRKSEAAEPPVSDKLQRILELGNQWKTMKQQHEIAAQQASSRRVDLTKEIF